MAIKIKEKLDLKDFLEANFPEVLQPFYKKRIFIINSLFGLLYLSIAGYIFYQTYKVHGKIETVHISFIVFGFIFFALAYYLSKRELKVYRKFIDQMNDLKTVYTIDENQISVENKNNKFSYRFNEISEFKELPKWLVFEFKNGEKISIYKPNIQAEDYNLLIEKFKKFK